MDQNTTYLQGSNSPVKRLYVFTFFFSDYVAIGPRFSNTVLQALLVLLKKKLRKVC